MFVFVKVCLLEDSFSFTIKSFPPDAPERCGSYDIRCILCLKVAPILFVQIYALNMLTRRFVFVCSLSWYFLVTFGLNGVYRLILGDDVDLDDTKMMQKQVKLISYAKDGLSIF